METVAKFREVFIGKMSIQLCFFKIYRLHLRNRSILFVIGVWGCGSSSIHNVGKENVVVLNFKINWSSLTAISISFPVAPICLSVWHRSTSNLELIDSWIIHGRLAGTYVEMTDVSTINPSLSFERSVSVGINPPSLPPGGRFIAGNCEAAFEKSSNETMIGRWNVITKLSNEQTTLSWFCDALRAITLSSRCHRRDRSSKNNIDDCYASDKSSWWELRPILTQHAQYDWHLKIEELIQ